ncbi:YbhB/YbcL family Raf kinase inhibitor-like protein [Pseudomonas sp. PSKL.D1]|uniref:YbhB/YbcL family Raf kinase inhibitor-like protein n=1 Tax=Pseudomonas sp. PSKL.D1 TaxID=3029060 RepID=UPI0023817B48|nr:YbhB/YbcL family Raf kinase inhibitor-like protein [Pseudomonas sp. PSKL.D1]WDY59087.1 YbhB/YbcL family Raf kinase inhibitor-like protein [Pseudomonas sp. PSKL.D1]
MPTNRDTILSKFFLQTSLLSTLLFSGGALADKFSIESTSFKDGEKISARHAGTDEQCGSGQGLSPHVQWKHLPEGTKSLAVFVTDPDGQKGTGTSHWVVYNIPATVTQLNEGLKDQLDGSYTVGLNTMGQSAYRGLCAQPDENSHHYTLTVVATTIEPGKLAIGLTRDALLKELKGHTLLGQSIVGLYR